MLNKVKLSNTDSSENRSYMLLYLSRLAFDRCFKFGCREQLDSRDWFGRHQLLHAHRFNLSGAESSTRADVLGLLQRDCRHSASNMAPVTQDKRQDEPNIRHALTNTFMHHLPGWRHAASFASHFWLTNYPWCCSTSCPQHSTSPCCHASTGWFN